MTAKVATVALCDLCRVRRECDTKAMIDKQFLSLSSGPAEEPREVHVCFPCAEGIRRMLNGRQFPTAETRS